MINPKKMIGKTIKSVVYKKSKNMWEYANLKLDFTDGSSMKIDIYAWGEGVNAEGADYFFEYKEQEGGK